METIVNEEIDTNIISQCETVKVKRLLRRTSSPRYQLSETSTEPQISHNKQMKVTFFCFINFSLYSDQVLYIILS